MKEKLKLDSSQLSLSIQDPRIAALPADKERELVKALAEILLEAALRVGNPILNVKGERDEHEDYR
jgi:hypothetical protein